MSFAANDGQFAPRVRYAALGAGYELAATDAGLELALGGQPRAHRLRGRRRRSPAAGGRLPGVANYLLGRDQRRWRTGVPTYREVVYRRVWPGHRRRAVRRDAMRPSTTCASPRAPIRAPRGSPSPAAACGSRATARCGSARCASSLRRRTSGGGGRRVAVASRYVRHADGTIGVRVGRYDRRRALVIDPVLAYSTYLGGSGTDEGTAIAVDGAGSAYVTGRRSRRASRARGRCGAAPTPSSPSSPPTAARSPGAPTSAAAASTRATGSPSARDGVVVGGWTTLDGLPDARRRRRAPTPASRTRSCVKLSPGGTLRLEHLSRRRRLRRGHRRRRRPGGERLPRRDDRLDGLPHRQRDPGRRTAAAATRSRRRSTASGALVYSTYLGGSGNDVGAGVAADGNAYLTGGAGSTDFPTTANALQPANGGSFDAFVTKLDPAGAPAYSTYLGGAGYDVAAAIALTPAGAPVVVGSTQSPAFPTTPGAPQAHLSGPSDAFVARLTTAGTALAASTYLGGSSVDAAGGVAVDHAGRTVVAGRTLSTDFPTVEPRAGGQGRRARRVRHAAGRRRHDARELDVPRRQRRGPGRRRRRRRRRQRVRARAGPAPTSRPRARCRARAAAGSTRS